MSTTLAGSFPPQPSEIPQTHGHLDHLLIVHRQPIYRELGELLFKVDGLLHEDGHQPGEEVFLGSEELGVVGMSGVARLDFVVGDRDGGSLPFITKTKFRDTPTPSKPIQSLFFAENYLYPSAFAVWGARYKPVGDEVNKGSEVRELKPVSRRRSRELLDFLSNAATHLAAKQVS